MRLNPKNKFSIFIFFIILIAGALYFWLKPSSTDDSHSLDHNNNSFNYSESIESQQNETLKSPFAGKSQQDIQINCQINADQSNRLIVNENTRNCFEFFITQIGEKEIPQIKADFISFSKQSYKDPLLSQLLDLWERYFKYREGLASLEEPKQKTNDSKYYKSVFDQIRNFRKKYFSDYEIEGLFGPEDIYNDYTLERLAVSENKSLSPQQKKEKYKELLNNLPEDLQKNIKQMTLLEDLNTQEAEIKARGGSAEELRQMRIELVGPEATQRLENLDVRRGIWKNHVTQFLNERNNIMQSGLSTQAKEQAVTVLKNKYFDSEQDKLRVSSFEKAQDEGKELPFVD